MVNISVKLSHKVGVFFKPCATAGFIICESYNFLFIASVCFMQTVLLTTPAGLWIHGKFFPVLEVI